MNEEDKPLKLIIEVGKEMKGILSGTRTPERVGVVLIIFDRLKQQLLDELDENAYSVDYSERYD